MQQALSEYSIYKYKFYIDWSCYVKIWTKLDQEFSLLQVFQTSSEAHPTSYPMGTGGKAAGVWSWPVTSS
jgi:hypothetical protein